MGNEDDVVDTKTRMSLIMFMGGGVMEDSFDEHHANDEVGS